MSRCLELNHTERGAAVCPNIAVAPVFGGYPFDTVIAVETAVVACAFCIFGGIKPAPIERNKIIMIEIPEPGGIFRVGKERR